jgi:hypothetical protein
MTDSPASYNRLVDSSELDLARYERYWTPRRRRLAAGLSRIWNAIRIRLPGLGRGGPGDPPPGPPFDPALVPTGPPRRPRPSSAAALELPDDDDRDGVVAYPRETD